MRRKLLTFSDNLTNDEKRNIKAHAVLRDYEAKRLIENIKEVDKEFSIYVGLEDEIKYRSGFDFVQRAITIKDLSDEEADTIVKFFGENFGSVDIIAQICEVVEFYDTFG